MNRCYSTAEFCRAANSIRSEMPHAAITTDVITGFPGETESEFAESYDFCRRMEFARLHIFPYSARGGTRAARMPGQIEWSVKKKRTQKMLLLAEASRQNFQQRCLEQVREVLFEQQAGGLWSGYTDTYVRVLAKSERDLSNRLLPVRLMGVTAKGVNGEIEP
jgi:threonylcarbamoyladenosine tRNA methylthiotransferase MtaB